MDDKSSDTFQIVHQAGPFYVKNNTDPQNRRCIYGCVHYNGRGLKVIFWGFDIKMTPLKIEFDMGFAIKEKLI